MLYKPRTQPTELKILKHLDQRMELPTKDKQYLLNLEKGFEGELIFDSLLEKIQCETYIINDLRLSSGNNAFQIDSLMITNNKVFFYEVKNYKGDFYYEEDKFFRSKYEIINPLHQLGRSKSLLHQVLQKNGVTLSIEASVVFINPEFTLYNSPIDKPIIHPTQINRYLKKFNSTPTKLNDSHRRLADTLLNLQNPEPSIEHIPTYDYNQLRKGLTCLNCNSFSIVNENNICKCEACGNCEKLEMAVKRNIDIFRLLFPQRKITTQAIHDWCQIVTSKKSIWKILNRNYQKKGENRWTYYE
ncbi:nuclease-related domain-containing protein [Alkalibacillus aidingensis]|uniref:nuclease-related domain-containing protein n=1 Tax=Alkalibacillus aidingensis TaxID=2747607 RepID=UPI001660C89F|nr:nuclease-related domain-containing protein [Alkalibacillus aidingensis]